MTFNRAVAFGAALALVVAAGCSGQTGTAPLLPTTDAPAQSEPLDPSPAAFTSSATSSASVTESGKITSRGTNTFDIKPVDRGYVRVTYTSATAISGSIRVGNYAKVTGTGSLSGPIAATSISTSTSSALVAATTVTQTGKITNVTTGRINIYTTSYVPVTYSSSTPISGSLKVGYYATVTGTPTSTGGIAATKISTASTSPITVSGKITNVVSGRINIYTTSYVPVTYNSATSISGTLNVGYYAKVTGTKTSTGGIAASSIVVTTTSSGGSTPTSTPAPTSGVMKHLITADYIGFSTTLRTQIAFSRLAPYLSWAQTTNTYADALHAVGIKTQRYVDPNRESSTGDVLLPNTSSGYAKTCSGSKVYTMYHTTVRYVPNPADSSFRSQWSSYVNTTLGPSHFDALYDDDAQPPGAFGTFSPSLPCNYSDSSWMSAEEGMLSYSKIPVIIAGLNGLDGQNPSVALALVRSSAAWGGNYEGCYAQSNRPESDTWIWQATENTELQVNAAGKAFQCYVDNQGLASSNTTSRIYALASYLLTYDPNKDILFETYATPSAFHVLPESQLVALDPLKPTPSSITSLKTSSGTYGVYGREYAHCYYAGSYVGPCAMAVNNDRTYSHPFPFSGYTHTLYVSGSGVLDGGTASVKGSAPSSSVAPDRAVIAFKN